MTDATTTLTNQLEELENEAIEKQKILMDHLKEKLRGMTEQHGREAVLAGLGDFTILNTLSTFVEQLPNTAKDNAALLSKISLPTSPAGKAT